MTEPFETSKFSIAWAKDHISDLYRELQAFADDDSNRTQVIERNADGTYELLKLRLIKPLPRCIRGHIIDTANNLRAALDQALFVIAGTHGYFPVRDSKTLFDTAMRDVSKKLPDKICDVIRRTQPYQGGDNLLWALNKLSGTNKHGIIHPMAFANYGMELKGTHTGRPPRFPYPPRWDSVKNEIVLAEIPVTDGECEVNIEYSFFIAFDQIEFIEGSEVATVLDRFAIKVEAIVRAIEGTAGKFGLV